MKAAGLKLAASVVEGLPQTDRNMAALQAEAWKLYEKQVKVRAWAAGGAGGSTWEGVRWCQRLCRVWHPLGCCRVQGLLVVQGPAGWPVDQSSSISPPLLLHEVGGVPAQGSLWAVRLC